MSSGRFVVSPQALDDLDEIWVFLASDSVEAADRVETAIREAIRKLAEFPELGHVTISPIYL